MRYAIFSDIHSNIHSLDAGIKKAQGMNVDKFVCLGDIVGYNAFPSECVHRVLRSMLFEICVQGNHDELVVLGGNSWWECSRDAIVGLEWSSKKISDTDRKLLTELPLQKEVEEDGVKIVFRHGGTIGASTLSEDRKFYYILNSFQLETCANYLVNEFKAHIAFCGHTHVPFYAKCLLKKTEDRIVSDIDYTTFVSGGFDRGNTLLESIKKGKDTFPIDNREGACYIVNVGSVGQPRLKNPPMFVILDTKAETVQFVVYDYNVAAAKAGITYSSKIAGRLDYRNVITNKAWT